MANEQYLHLVRPDCPVPPGTRVVAYCRDSGHEDQDRSVSQQLQAMREYCAHHQLLLERTYVDEAKVSSSTERRDQLNAMLLDLRHRFRLIHDRYKREKQAEKQPFGVICWKSNRLSRDSLETTHIKADLRMRGITIVSMITSAETSDPGVNALIESFQHYQDEKALDEISENSRRGLAQLVGTRDTDPAFRQLNPDWATQDGRYLGIMPGRLPTGFKGEPIRIGINERRRRTTFSGEVRIVQRAVPNHDNNLWERCRLAWKMRHEGCGIKPIMAATQLFTTAGGYSTFFSNRIYTGDFEYGDKVYVDFVPALIPREWYDEEQHRKQERAAKLQKLRSDPLHEPRRVASRHLLTGLVFCCAVEGEEHPMMADTVPGREGKRTRWDFYICTHKKNSRDQTCTASRVGAAALDQAVIENLMTHILTRENLRPIANALAETLLERNLAVNERIMAIQGQLDGLRKSLNQLLDAIEKVGLSASIQSRLAQREAEERDLIVQLSNLEDLLLKPADIPKITDEKLDEWIESIRQALSGDNIELARKAVRQFVAKIVVHEKAGTIYYTFPLSDLSRNGIMPHTGFEPVSQP